MEKDFTLENLDMLFNISDLSEEEYDKMKQSYLSQGKSENLKKALLSRSKLANIRNLIAPSGEIYAPVDFTSDYIVKYIEKPSWGHNNHIATITLWDLLVIDIDEKDRLPYIKQRIDRYYPDELFNIHETTRGYHLFLVSKKLNHCSNAAIFMRMKLGTDVAHGTNSLYTGPSVRLTRKKWEDQGHQISRFTEQYGNGVEDPEAVDLYNTVVKWLFYFHNMDTEHGDMQMVELHKLWKKIPKDFGKTHIRASAPYLLDSNGIKPGLGHRHQSPDQQKIWSKYLKYNILKDDNLVPLLACVQYQMAYDNLYRIFEATKDYAIGVHTQHNVHFISYKDLLFLDYDDRSRLAIVARFARKHPEYVFRVVSSPKGYHVFLTSHRMLHNNIDSLKLLMDLRSDPSHILGIYHRGYSVRVNQKDPAEKPYREVTKYGKEEEDPELVELYQKHLDLYQQHCQQKTSVCRYQSKRAMEIYKEQGVMNPY